MLLILILLLLIFGGFGFWNSRPAGYGPYVGWSPLGLLVLVIAILAIAGYLHF